MKNYSELLSSLDNGIVESDTAREAAAAIRELQALKTPARSMYKDVEDFHFKFGIPVAGSGPCKMPLRDVIDYRTRFLYEEIEEFIKACAEDNLAEAFDALLDITWVAMGTAHYFGAPWDEGWAEVVRANMDRVSVTRENCPPEKQYRKDMVVKPPGWVPPQLMRVISDHNLRIREQEKQLNIPDFLRKFPDEPGFVGGPKTPSDVVSTGMNKSTEHHGFNCLCSKCASFDEATGE